MGKVICVALTSLFITEVQSNTEVYPSFASIYIMLLFIWDNIIWAPKKIKPEILKILFGRLNNLFDLLIKLFGPSVGTLKLDVCRILKIIIVFI